MVQVRCGGEAVGGAAAARQGNYRPFHQDNCSMQTITNCPHHELHHNMVVVAGARAEQEWGR